MKFEPTYNYSNTDLSNKDNLVLWKFGELIKNLITLSSNAKRQFEIVGYGAVCDEMAEDFHTYFSTTYAEYMATNLLTPAQLCKLQQLDTFFDTRSGDQSPAFWENTSLETKSDWDEVRAMASDILLSLGMHDLTLEVDRNVWNEKTDNGKEISIEATKTRLARKNAS